MRKQVDVLVVGTGMSGSAAAMTAGRTGVTVAMVEKQTAPGGSAALSAGMFWTAPTVEAYQARIPAGNLDLGSRLIGEYDDAVAELRASGVRVATEPLHDIMTFGIGYSLDINAVLQWCREEVVRAGGEVLTGAAVTDLVQRDGCATGAVVRRSDGSVLEYDAAAVVIASGGFQGARDELARHIGRTADRLILRSNPGSVGDGLRLARAAGAGGTTGMSTFYGHLLPHPLRHFTPDDFLPYSQYYSGSTVLVNLRGERFVDETLGDELLNQEVTFQPEARGVLIFDEHVRRTVATDEPFPGLGSIDRFAVAVEAGGTHATAETLPELIERVGSWGVDAEALADTLARYTSMADAGGGVSRGVRVASTARPPRTSPYHALMVQPSITFTFGGIPINPRGEVLDHDGRAIPGLFAAGADIGGLSNYGYAGGLAPAYLTGRWAGLSAAERARRDRLVTA